MRCELSEMVYNNDSIIRMSRNDCFSTTDTVLAQRVVTVLAEPMKEMRAAGSVIGYCIGFHTVL